MQKKLNVFLLVSSFFLLKNSVFASSALTNLKNNIESHALTMDYLDNIFLIARRNGFVNSTFEITYVPGHFIVKNKSTGQIYDSGDGRGGVIRQHFADCLLHSTDNLFYLESFNGQLPYSGFSAKMRESLDMTIFYSFIKLYIYLKGSVFRNFNMISLDSTVSVGQEFFYLKDNSIAATTIPAILREAGITSAHTENDFIQMLYYIFTDMKNKMGLPGAFSFEEDIPHLLWVFGDALGYKSLDVERLLNGYFDKYEKMLIESNNNLINKYNIIGYNSSMFVGFIPFSPDRIKDLEAISNLYVLQEKIIQKNLSQFSRNENNSNFNLDYGNSKLSNKNGLGYNSLSFSYIGEYEFFENIKFGLLFDYEQSTTSSNGYDMALKNVIVGGTFKKLYKYDRKSNFNTGILVNFKINNKGNISKKDYEINFNNENITLFLQDYRNLNINTPIISTINISSTFNYTNYNIRNVNISNGLDNYNIMDNRYHLFSLNFELDFIKTFKFSKKIRSNLTLNTRVVNYLNKPSNRFKLVNKYYDSVYFISDNIIEARNNLWFNFKADIQFGKYVEISGIIGTNVMLKEDTFIGASLMVKF